MLITSTPMTDLAPAIGLRVLKRLANASLNFGWGRVAGVLSDEPVDAMLGSLSVQSRRKRFICASDDLAEIAGGVQIGTPCELEGAPWLVAELTANPQAGQITLQLERA